MVGLSGASLRNSSTLTSDAFTSLIRRHDFEVIAAEDTFRLWRAVVKDVTNANSVPEDFDVAKFDDKWQEGWLMLAGIEFPSPGCWDITGKYLDQSLTFVVQTIASVEEQTRAK